MKIKINSVKAMIVASLIIIILYIIGLFLPIIKNTKNSENFNFSIVENNYKI